MRTIISKSVLQGKGIPVDWFVARFGEHARIDLATLLKRLTDTKDGDIVEMLVESLALTYKVKKFYPDGTLESITPFVSGKQHGVVLVFHPNGKLSIKESFKMGEPHGPYYIYDEQGRLTEKGYRQNGKQHGILQYHVFRDTGEILTIRSHYSYGIRNGVTTFSVDRELVRATYVQNQLRELKVKDVTIKYFPTDGIESIKCNTAVDTSVLKTLLDIPSTIDELKLLEALEKRNCI
jgi:hypothetical protein